MKNGQPDDATEAFEDGDVRQRAMAPRPRARWWLLLATAVIASFILARAIPPFYPDGTWWGTFFTSAGFGGSLAVIGAGVASYIAYHNSRSDRDQKHDADDLARWWARFAWAAEKAVSRTPSESVMGLTVLDSLIDAPWAREEDNEMALAVFEAIREAADQTAAVDQTAAADQKKRWWHK